MKSNHERNVSGMHEAPRCQAKTKAGAICRKPAIRGRTRCESHGGKGAATRNRVEERRTEDRSRLELQWQLERQARDLEKEIRKLRRTGGSIDTIAFLAGKRQALLELAGQGAAELAAEYELSEGSQVKQGEGHSYEAVATTLGPNHPIHDLNRGKARGAMLGLAVGEAIGITTAGQKRGSFRTIEHMRGGGLLGLKAGQWAGDTAMALALMDSLICQHEFDAGDYMERLLDWRDKGDYSCTGEPVGMDDAVCEALARYDRTRQPGDVVGSLSNGSLARVAPVAIRYWQQSAVRGEVALRQSESTHGHLMTGLGCVGLADMIAEAISDRPKSQVFAPRIIQHDSSDRPLRLRGLERLGPDDVRGSDDALISLEAAIWCVGSTVSFQDAVLAAANLGEDAGSVAAIAGQLAGALYGISAIPADWLDQLASRERIVEMADALFDLAPAPHFESD